MINLLSVFKICVYLAVAVIIFLKYRNNIVGKLSILWLILRIFRILSYYVFIFMIKKDVFMQLTQSFRKAAYIFKVYDTVLLLLLAAICIIVIAKVEKEKKNEKLKEREEAILAEAKEKGIIK
ncbi:MAG: hypothetical protein AB1Z23_01490 [Eubacteriales bacterium]